MKKRFSKLKISLIVLSLILILPFVAGQFSVFDWITGMATGTTAPTIVVANSASTFSALSLNQTNTTLFHNTNLNASLTVTDAELGKTNISAQLFVNKVYSNTITVDNIPSGGTPSFVFSESFWLGGNNVTVQFNGTNDGTATAYSNTSIISVNDTAATIGNISDIAAQTITEDNFKAFTFYFVASDPDGNLNNNSARINITNVNSTDISSNVSCLPVSSINTYTVNYSCQAHIWYYYLPGEWKITAQINSSSPFQTDKASQNTTKVFTIQDTTAVTVGPASLTFPSVSVGADNITSNNDPIIINNTGNHNTTAGNIKVTGVNLRGETDASYIIPAANFTIRETTGGSPAVECGGNFMINGTQVAITNSTLAPGNRTAGQGTENIYGCLYDAPTSLITQTYSATGGNSWTITIQ